MRTAVHIAAIATLAMLGTAAEASGGGSYVDVLHLLATQPRQDCLPALEQYESAAIDPDRPAATLQKLEAGELGVLRRIARQSGGEALLPVIALHLDSYLYYLKTDARLLMRHSRTITAEAIDLFVKSSDRDGSDGMAAWMLTKLGGNVLQTRTRRAAETLLYEALTFSGGYARARLGLAAIREKEGRYDEAVALLTDANEPQPHDRAEVSLRLAINLGRIGESNDATALFERLTRGSETPSWIRSLAYQESSRLLFADEQWDRARSLLEEAVQILPDDEPLLLQLAYAHERLGTPRAAQAVAEKVDPMAVVEETEHAELRPRDRYNRYPLLAAPPEEEQQLDLWITELSETLGEALAQMAGPR